MLFTRRLLGGFLSRRLMPSQRNKNFPKDEPFEPGVRHLEGASADQFLVASSGGGKAFVSESCVENKKNLFTKKTQVILHSFGGNDCVERHIDDLDAKQRQFPGVVMVGMNFRNVHTSGESRVCSEQDWIDDVIAVVNHYREEKGVLLKNIILSGCDVGASAMVMAAAQIYPEASKQFKQAQNIKILTPEDKLECSPKLFCDRPFSTLVDKTLKSSGRFSKSLMSAVLIGSVAAMMAPMSAVLAISGAFFVSGLVFPKISEFFLRPMLKTFLWLGFGSMDNVSAYKGIPEGAKDYVMAKDDKTDSLHHALKANRRSKKNIIRYEMAHATDEKFKIALGVKLEAFRDSKLLADTTQALDAHVCPLSMLKRYEKTRKGKKKSYQLTEITGEAIMLQKCTKMLLNASKKRKKHQKS